MSLMNKPRILVVDEDEGACRTLPLILERKRYDVVTASTARKALEAANDGRFNVGLLDIRLPDRKDVELLKPLQERHPDMELIMVTGYASSETAIRALNEGATAYITKPLNMDEVGPQGGLGTATRLGGAVRRALDTERTEEETRG